MRPGKASLDHTPLMLSFLSLSKGEAWGVTPHPAETWGAPPRAGRRAPCFDKLRMRLSGKASIDRTPPMVSFLSLSKGEAWGVTPPSVAVRGARRGQSVTPHPSTSSG